MGGLLVLILIGVVVYWCVKKKGKKKERTISGTEKRASSAAAPLNPTPGINRIPADALINSPYYEKYKEVCDHIWYYNKQHLQENLDSMERKIHWLMESMEMGREIEDDGYYVTKSLEERLPYFCETEREFDYFCNEEKPVLKGAVYGILDLASFYSYQERVHLSKQKYWKQTLQEMAMAGNLEAQAILCTRRARVAFSEGEINGFKLQYEKALYELAAAGNPQAQLAVGEYLAPYGSREKIDWLTKAANQGIGDAWYHLGEAYNTMIYIDEKGNRRTTPLSEEQIRKLSNMRNECRFRAADSNNGIMVGYCQYWVGTNYEEGDSIFPKDLEKAKYWYQKAVEHGSKRAESCLQRLNERPESF